MTEFIFMLTRNDATVPDALAVYDEIRSADLRYVGFKDIGLPVEELRKLARAIQADGREVMLEVVSENAADELRSIRAAVDIGVDWVLGGTNPETRPRRSLPAAVRATARSRGGSSATRACCAAPSRTSPTVPGP